MCRVSRGHVGLFIYAGRRGGGGGSVGVIYQPYLDVVLRLRTTLLDPLTQCVCVILLRVVNRSAGCWAD